MGSSSLLVITLAIFHIAGSSLAAGDSFTVNLLHRDSVDSPFYDHSMSFSQRVGHALRRSFTNAKRYKTNLDGSIYQADLIPDVSEFLIDISIGNPSHKVLAIADTGSDLSWIQCNPCIRCYNHTGPVFDPKSSSTYRPVACESTTCKALSYTGTTCSATKNCRFSLIYGDGSISNGTVARETVTLCDRAIRNIVFGCSFINEGIFEPSWDGIVGLGGGDYSLTSQILALVPRKLFSYCLIPYPSTNPLSNKFSKIIFGYLDFGPKIVSTPLIQKNPKTFYFVTLEAISVDDTRLNISDDSNSSNTLEKGNMIVDSGTTLTMLPPKLYDDFETAVRNAISLGTTMKNPQKQLSLCYLGSTVTKLPKVTMHFEGADVELRRDNLFMTVDDDIICLAFAPTSDILIMGNLAQINYMVGYDLENNMLLFKPTDCEKM
ncbi:hypothetical protein SSX86_012915 [Deinandra increscens subsp. villosa]|uniref:Peptidase A1 domain-containing protein n=1 Tax=Deinandra increscens subsp. villosa TaxID=3103831 RepID=A0AAP0DCN5_9ASTR